MRQRLQTPLLIVTLLWPTLATWYYFFYLADRPGVSAAYLGAKLFQAILPLIGWYLLAMPRAATVGPSRKGVLQGLMWGGILGGSVLLAYFTFLRGSALLATAPEQIGSRLNAFGANSPIGFVTIALVLSGAHSLFEEYYWRWFVFGALRDRMSLPVALVFSSLAFASHHFLVIDRFLGRENLWATLPFGLAVAGAGAIWSLLLVRYRSLIPGWISHALVDGAVMLVGYSLLWTAVR
ncbi:MAG: CPBP family intramembrane metalloprotease [Thermoanaerobaculia bacterium]|nr:CPBP family intramembrane metalloprotease [Thermoanaerobaculia bacterium]